MLFLLLAPLSLAMSNVLVSTEAELRQALTMSADVIRLAQGEYLLTQELSINRDVTITANVTGQDVSINGQDTTLSLIHI